MAKVSSRLIRFLLIGVALICATVVELKHFVPYFRLYTFIALFVVFLLATTLARGKWRDGLLLATTVFFGLCLVEASAYFFIEKRPISIMTQGWAITRPVIGWGPEHAGVFHARHLDGQTHALIYDADYTIDANLLRETHGAASGPALVFFGDSYTFGDGLNDSDTLPQQVSDLLHGESRVLNLGVTGYGPQQFLREVETGIFDSIIGDKPKLFFFQTAAWHAERTSCKAEWMIHAPHYHLAGDGVAFDGPCNEGVNLLWREFLQNTAIYRVFIMPYRQKITHDDVELYVRVLNAAVEKSKAKYGVTTIIPYLRVPEAYLNGTGFTNESLMARLKESGAKVIDASLSDAEAQGTIISIPGDGHPTAIANRLRARLLVDQFEAHNW